MGLADGKAAFLAQAQAAMEGLFPGTLRVRGQDHPVARTPDTYAERPADGGYEEDVGLSVRLRTELEPERLADGTIVELDGRALRVRDVKLGADDVAWEIELRRV